MARQGRKQTDTESKAAERTRARRMPAARRRADLLEALGLVVAERGYQGATVDAVAERAGVSHGVFYHYFSDIDAAFLELMRGALEPVRAAVCSTTTREAEVAGRDLGAFPIEEELYAFYRMLGERLREKGGVVREAFVAAAAGPGPIRSELEGFLERVIATLRASVEACSGRNAYRRLDADFTPLALLGLALSGILYADRLMNDDALERWAREMSAFESGALRKSPRTGKND